MENRDIVKRFLSTFPSLSVSQAKKYLESNNWDLRQAVLAAEKEEEEKLKKATRNEFYSGGGQLIAASNEDGNDQKQQGDDNVEELVNSLFQKAKSEADQSGESTERSRAFFGEGRRLGHTLNPSPPMASTLLAHRAVSLELYQNGFHLDNGDFIPLDSPEGTKGMKEMLQGYVPAFLQKLYPQTELSLTLHDKSSLPYSVSKGESSLTSSINAASVSFRGTGHRLTSVSTSSSSVINDAVNDDWHPKGTFTVDENEEISFIVLVDTDGKRNEFKVNPHQHTLCDVYTLAKRLEPDLATFQMIVRGMPPKKLSAESRNQTISEAKLTRAVIIIQKVESRT